MCETRILPIFPLDHNKNQGSCLRPRGTSLSQIIVSAAVDYTILKEGVLTRLDGFSGGFGYTPPDLKVYPPNRSPSDVDQEDSRETSSVGAIGNLGISLQFSV